MKRGTNSVLHIHCWLVLGRLFCRLVDLGLLIRVLLSVCMVLFSVSVTEGLTEEGVRKLRAWMRRLPCFAGLELDGVYPGKAMCLVLRSALSVYTKLHRVQGYSLIAEGVGAPVGVDCLV